MTDETTSSRRGFIKGCGLTLAAAAMGGCELMRPSRRTAVKRPNILWIIAEDICPDIACYGEPLVKTPNLDRLAAEGVRFTNAYSTAPVCSATRSAFNTGMYQTSIGCHHHRTYNKQPLPAGVRPLSQILHDAGYFTANGYGDPEKNNPGKTDYNFLPNGKLFDGTDWSQCPPDRPFFAQIQSRNTHRVFSRDPQRPIDPSTVKIPPQYPDHPLARRDWANYLEAVQVLDREVGQVLDRLEREGLADNTVVMFFGDHGRPHVRAKQWLYDGGIHVPLIIRRPGRLDAGTVDDDFISLIDLMPTSLGLAGLKVPEGIQGQDIFNPNSVKRDKIFAARDRCDGVYDRIRCVRSKRFKYIRNYEADRPYTQFGHYKAYSYPVLHLMHVLYDQGKLTPAQQRFMAAAKDPEELYDLHADPHELNNLAEQPEYKQVLNTMRVQLDRWMAETKDQGDQIEIGADAPLRIKAIREKKYTPKWKKRGMSPHDPHEKHLQWWAKEMEVEI